MMRGAFIALFVSFCCGGQSLPAQGNTPASKSISPHVGVVALDQHDNELTPVQRDHIAFAERSISFQLTGSPAIEGSERFRYRLMPILPVWTETSQTKFWFPSLPSGRYSFEVQFLNSPQAKWSDSQTLAFEILAPWWLHPYILILLLALALLLIRELHRIRVVHMLKRQHELENAVQTRTKELEAERVELLAAREELTSRATRDGLTGLWNRTAIFEILERELERAKRGEKPVAVILADLDHFKQVNDTYGHSAGDTVLTESARRLTCDLRTYDATGRYGGEELLIVLSNCDQPSALARAEDLRIRLRDEPIRLQGSEIWVTCSFGVAISRSDSTCQQILHEADEALYRAKKTGRDRVAAAWVDVSERTEAAPASARRS